MGNPIGAPVVARFVSYRGWKKGKQFIKRVRRK